MQAAMTMKPVTPESPPQAQSLMNALHGFTLGSAYCEFAEHQKGMLKAGMLADLVILNGNLETTAPETISTIKPTITICDGRITYEA